MNEQTTLDRYREAIERIASGNCTGPDEMHCCYVRLPPEKWCPKCIAEQCLTEQAIADSQQTP